jgi:hypothetical protein
MKIDFETPVDPGQKYEVDRFRPEDATGVANLFVSTYGLDYPIETYYIPERIIEENRKRNILTVVARTPKGDIVAQGALYRSSPPYPNLYEVGLFIVLKDYRGSLAAYKIKKYIMENLAPGAGIDEMFGEGVTNHIVTQKLGASFGMKYTALEVDLMPASAYEKEESASGRVSCIVGVRSYRDRPQEVYIPGAYREQIDFILSDCPISRTTILSTDAIPPDAPGETDVKFFSDAGVGRANVSRVGTDFESFVEQLDRDAREQGIVALQLFLNLDVPWIGAAVDMLREKGYFLGGYLPRWFDSDGLLMQKLQTTPDFDSINLYTDKAKTIREMVQADWRRTVR